MKSQFLARATRQRGGSTNRTSRSISLPAPVKGMVTAEGLASTSPRTALLLDNVFPTTTGVRWRGGSRTVATVSDVGDPVESVFAYNAPQNRKVFAATETEIFDVTSVADPLIPPAPAVTGQTAGYYSALNYTTSGGQYMTVVNGADDLLLYDPGSGFVPLNDLSIPAITGVETSRLSFVWAYRNRQMFIEANSLRAWYLPVNSVAGAMESIDCNGIAQRGGYFVFGGTWSVDTGDGLDDKCVMVTSEGEVIVFEGSDPGDANDWRLIGRYEITAPMGPRCTMRAGGDLVIGVEDGMVPISAAVSKDAAALSMASISRAIAPDWKREAIARRSLPWECIKWPRQSYAIISLPSTSAGQAAIQFVVNTETGAWCRYSNWDVRCMVLHADQLYFGTSDGRVKIGEVGGSDDGAGIYYTIISNPERLGDAASVKNILAARSTFTGSTPFRAKTSVSVNYNVDLPAFPTSAPDVSTSTWDTGLWDVALWDAAVTASVVTGDWVSIGATGFVFQYQVQGVGGLTPRPDTELISVDFIYEGGGVMV